VGQTVVLSAYEEQKPAHWFRSAGPDEPFTRNGIEPVWSVSDPTLASIESSGLLKGVKPGQVTVKVVWEGHEFSEEVKVLPELRAHVLPKLAGEGSFSPAKGISLSLGANRSLSLKATFDDPRDNVAFEGKAPEQRLPWNFAYDRGTIEITDAAGHAVTGAIKNNNGGVLRFTAYSDGDGSYPISLQGKTVMVVGDSMVDGFTWFMKDKVEAAGGRYVAESWISSTTVAWAGTHRMSEMVAKYQPDIVFITLGSNEIDVPKVESRSAAVKTISDEMGDRPGFWIGPPSWVPDKGIVKVIEQNFRPGHFYNANDLKVPRRDDGKHPNREGFKIWVDLVWDWYAKVE
jgi:lysophospholipase L1-like esterase